MQPPPPTNSLPRNAKKIKTCSINIPCDAEATRTTRKSTQPKYEAMIDINFVKKEKIFALHDKTNEK